jgi:hypothetical protein
MLHVDQNQPTAGLRIRGFVIIAITYSVFHGRFRFETSRNGSSACGVMDGDSFAWGLRDRAVHKKGHVQARNHTACGTGTLWEEPGGSKNLQRLPMTKKL